MVAARIADRDTKKSLRHVVKPNSISKTLRRAGIGLILAPDPISAVPGAIMLGASLAARGREPMNPASIYNETRKLLSELGAFF